jgi:ADP-ribose pyrophosphatase YjhB (NUDIX family)
MNNSNPRIGSYIEPGYAPKPVFVDDEVYKQILDAVVLACLDMVLVHEGKVLLGKRAWHPQADWWIIGGRMRPGEELEVAAARYAKRDLGLELALDRFSYLTTFSSAWKLRRHEPADHGTHTTSIVMTIELTAEEASSIKLNEEYTEQQWLTSAEILANVDFHPALHQCARALSQGL